MNIAILVPVTSRNQTYTSLSDSPFFKCLYPSFEKTKCDGYTYTFFIGYDDDDVFYKENSSQFDSKFRVLELSGCQHAPARAWNKLAIAAFDDPNVVYDYFFQVGDDVIMKTPGWTSQFINKLQSHKNLGVVGPCNIENYTIRISRGMPHVIENAFVHRTHLVIFGYFFHPSITNWYCDDWITRIYDGHYSETQLNILCQNTIVNTRYVIEIISNSVHQYISEGIDRLKKRRVLSYCVFGTQDKYCLGMVKNLEQIKVLFPSYEIWIGIGNDVPQNYIDIYKSYSNVKLTHFNCNKGRLTAYRLFPIDDPTIEIVFTRDADSRFSDRDIWCMNQFINSDYKIFTIRDHIFQTSKLQLGQTGFRNLGNLNVRAQYMAFLKTIGTDIDYYYNDQQFANDYIYDKFHNNIVAFTPYAKYPGEIVCNIDIARKSDTDFCGNVYLFDEHGNECVEFSIHGKRPLPLST